jgi:hypothetical protein
VDYNGFTKRVITGYIRKFSCEPWIVDYLTQLYKGYSMVIMPTSNLVEDPS